MAKLRTSDRIGDSDATRIPLALALRTNVHFQGKRTLATERYHLILALRRNIAPLPQGMSWPQQSAFYPGGAGTPLVWAYARDQARSPEWISVPEGNSWCLWRQKYDLTLTRLNNNERAEWWPWHFMHFYDSSSAPSLIGMMTLSKLSLEI